MQLNFSLYCNFIVSAWNWAFIHFLLSSLHFMKSRSKLTRLYIAIQTVVKFNVEQFFIAQPWKTRKTAFPLKMKIKLLLVPASRGNQSESPSSMSSRVVSYLLRRNWASNLIKFNGWMLLYIHVYLPFTSSQHFPNGKLFFPSFDQVYMLLTHRRFHIYSCNNCTAGDFCVASGNFTDD